MNTETRAAIAKLVYTLTDPDDLRSVNELVRVRFKEIQRREVFNWKLGDKVEFDAGPRRGTFFGQIVKINRAKIKVRVPQGAKGLPQVWNVSPSLLRKA